jgi:ferredoxin
MATLMLSTTDTALSLPINPDQNLLEHCLGADLPVTRSCRNGNCGRCDSSLDAGHVRLRNDKEINAPAIIPLCITFAASDVSISKIPMLTLPSHWRCQWQNPMLLRLPAGRQIPPKQGDICALLMANAIELNEIANIDGRNIHLLLPTQNCSEQDSLSLIIIDREHHGEYSLFREHEGQQTRVWKNINHRTALAAQAAYQQHPESARYSIHDLDQELDELS